MYKEQKKSGCLKYIIIAVIVIIVVAIIVSNGDSDIDTSKNPQSSSGLPSISTNKETESEKASETLPAKPLTANEQYAAKLSAEYDVTIIGKAISAGEKVGNYYTSYSTPTEEDVTKFLNNLDAALSRYPKGLFTAMKKNRVEDLKLIPTGIMKNNSTGSEAAGLTSTDGWCPVIYFSLEYVDRTGPIFSHEFMHAIEKATQLDNAPSYNSAFIYWKDCNPAGFTYASSYDEVRNDMLYAFDEKNPNYQNTYFVNTYGKVSEAEDLAMVFEYMVLHPEHEIFKCPNILRKANYLSAVLKQEYPEWYANGTPIWDAYKK